MRRKRPTEAARAEPAVPLVLNPLAVFTFAQARQALALPRSTLAREVRLRRLRVAKRAGKYWILGSWLLQWIEAGELHRRAGDPPLSA
jgi:hypothetical protein